MSLVLVALLQACQVSSGRVSSCPGTSYTGTAVVQVDGRYRRCKVSNGRAHECAGWYSGDAPAKGKDGRWQRCRISTGRVFSCDAVGYNGTVVLSR